MYTRLPRPGTHPRTAALLRRIGALLAGACALLALAAASPAMAMTVSLPTDYGPAGPPAQVPAQVHTMTAGGMPGWQITLIAAGAAVLAALLAVTADRIRAARRHVTAPSL